MNSPWKVQAHLMEISGQLPASLGVGHRTNGPTLLYAALTMEEFAETLAELQCMLVAVDRYGDEPTSPEDPAARSSVQARELLSSLSRMMQSYSQSIRHLIKWTARDGNHFVLSPSASPESLKGLADGLTDTAVTLFGLCVASGLPIEECYHEVQRSNLSKANPVSGLIDKDPSGKWIKSSAYTPPNLGPILGLPE